MFENNYGKLFAASYRISGNRTDAKDLITETYLDIIERKKEPPKDKEGFIKWMTTYLKFHYLSRYGRFKKQKTGTEQPIDTWKETIQEDDDLPRVLSVESFKTTLDALDRVLFELIYEQELSYSQIIRRYKERGFEIKRHTLHKLTQQLKTKINDTRNLKLYRPNNRGLVICSWSSSDTMDQKTTEHRLGDED